MFFQCGVPVVALPTLWRVLFPFAPGGRCLGFSGRIVGRTFAFSESPIFVSATSLAGIFNDRAIMICWLPLLRNPKSSTVFD